MSSVEWNISRHCHACKKYVLKKKLTLCNYVSILMRCKSNLKLSKPKQIVLLLMVSFITNYIFGITEYAYATSFSMFSYPLHIDVRKVINDLKNSVKTEVTPVNNFDFGFRINNAEKCQNPATKEFLQLRLLYIVKSAVSHHELRSAIRKTWGYENRFVDVPIRTVFVLGIGDNSSYTQDDVDLENSKYGDLIQGNFIDSYFNNTLKTMMSLKWAMEHCKHVNVFAFVDDDYYVSTKMLLRYLRNPFNEDITNPNPYKIFRNKQ